MKEISQGTYQLYDTCVVPGCSNVRASRGKKGRKKTCQRHSKDKKTRLTPPLLDSKLE